MQKLIGRGRRGQSPPRAPRPILFPAAAGKRSKRYARGLGSPGVSAPGSARNVCAARRAVPRPFAEARRGGYPVGLRARTPARRPSPLGSPVLAPCPPAPLCGGSLASRRRRFAGGLFAPVLPAAGFEVAQAGRCPARAPRRRLMAAARLSPLRLPGPSSPGPPGPAGPGSGAAPLASPGPLRGGRQPPPQAAAFLMPRRAPARRAAPLRRR